MHAEHTGQFALAEGGLPVQARPGPGPLTPWRAAFPSMAEGGTAPGLDPCIERRPGCADRPGARRPDAGPGRPGAGIAVPWPWSFLIWPAAALGAAGAARFKLLEKDRPVPMSALLIGCRERCKPGLFPAAEPLSGSAASAAIRASASSRIPGREPRAMQGGGGLAPGAEVRVRGLKLWSKPALCGTVPEAASGREMHAPLEASRNAHFSATQEVTP